MIGLIKQAFYQRAIINGRSFLTTLNVNQWSRSHFLFTMFYGFTLLVAIKSLGFHDRVPNWKEIIEAESLFDPVWVVQWMKYFPWEIVVKGSILGFLITSIITLLFWQKHWSIRLIQSVFFLNYLGLISSFGKVDHYLHIMLFASFANIFFRRSSKGSNLPTIIFIIQTL